MDIQTNTGPIKIDELDHLKNLIEISESAGLGVGAHYRGIGLKYIDVPEVVGITGACENVDTLFRVNNRLGIPLFFTQTGQLALEQALQKFSGVWTVIQSGRDEEEEDERHLRQFRLTEEEFDCTGEKMGRKNYDPEKMFVILLEHIENASKAMIGAIMKDHAQLLKKQYNRQLPAIKDILDQPYFRIDYEKAVEMLQKNGFPEVKFGDDLKALHEQKIVELLASKNKQRPVFITRYPKEIKFFNMMVSQNDDRVVLSADLILPTSGESAGSAVREHDGQKLEQRLVGSRMFELHTKRGGTLEDFRWYLDMIKGEKTNPHAGYGLGNERLFQFLLGLTDIRQASVLHLTSDASKIASNFTFFETRRSTESHFLANPVYDIEKSYDWNYEAGPKFKSPIPPTIYPAKTHNFLGHEVNSLMGVAAGPVLNSTYVKLYSELGFDIITYKTVRTRSYASLPSRNIVFLTEENGGKLTATSEFNGDLSKLAVTNSFAIPSRSPDVWQKDVRESLQVLKRGQTLIVSVVGTYDGTNNKRQLIEDYALCARLAKEAGAPIVEVNLSCPNIDEEGLVCKDLDLSREIVMAVRKAVGDTPILAKISQIGSFEEGFNLVMELKDHINGLVAINTLRRLVASSHEIKVNGAEEKISGVCGPLIKNFALDSVAKLSRVIAGGNHKITLIGVGGVIKADDYFDFRSAGADAVLSATGAIFNPYLAFDVKKAETRNSSPVMALSNLGGTDYKKTYLSLLSSQQQNKDRILVVSKTPMPLKNGESGRKESKVYLNHRQAVFVDAWKRKTILKMLLSYIYEKILPPSSEFNLIAVPSDTSPELTAAIFDSVNSTINRAIILPSDQPGNLPEKIFGNLDPALPTIVLDDVFTSGGTLKQSVGAIRKVFESASPIAPIHSLVLCCRNPELAPRFEKETGSKLFYLTSLDEVLSAFNDNFTVSEKELIVSERPQLFNVLR